jgi:hypothetical protein
MGALRLGKLALLAVLGPFAGRMQTGAHPKLFFKFPGSFLEQS